MALKGTINGSTSNPDILSKIEWSATQSISGNYSDVTINLYLRRSDSLTTYGSGSFSIKADGTSKSSSAYVSIGGSWVKVSGGIIRVNHASDGSKSATISGSGSIPGTTLTSISCSSTVKLDTIPRASIPSGSAVNFGGTLRLTMNRKSSSFTHTVSIKVGSHTSSKSGIGAETTFAIPESWADAAPTSNSVDITISTTTYNGGTQIGTSTVKIAANVPAGWVPSFDDVTATSDNTLSNQFLATLSRVTVSARGGVASYGAAIKSWTFAGPNLSQEVKTNASSASVTSQVLTQVGDLQITVTLTDGRGRKASKAISITSIDYKPPTINVSVDRYNPSGTQDDIGAFAKVLINGEFSNVSGNSYTVKVEKRENKADPGDFLPVQTWTGSTTPFNYLSNLFEASDTASWQIRTTITDAAGASISLISILQTGAVLMDFLKGGKGIALGRTATGPGFFSHLDFFVDALKHLDGTDWMDDAIIEADIPNSSTEWKTIKTAKGLAMCWIKIVGTASINSTWGSIFTNASKPYATFPFSFIAEPTVFIAPSSVTGLNGDYWIGKVNMSQTASRSGDIGLWRATSATGVNYGIYVLAIGRYK